ncbi:MAG: hypothetical protein HYX79_05730 [Chloroflexi bacterium]|nr:hypothetical protein [Chloroflexota bacterium]
MRTPIVLCQTHGAANGSISPVRKVTVDSGANQTFNISANRLPVANVLVDGEWWKKSRAVFSHFMVLAASRNGNLPQNRPSTRTL